MSVINKHISIPKSIETKDDLDFHFLRKKGIEYIENLGGNLWTDFNSHDPGITMLEMLSYAITDLGMRINMPIEDLLTYEDKSKGIADQFYKASEIFRTNPVTELDYRKLFIDIEGVKNCWLQRYHKKVYVNCKTDLLSYNEEDINEATNSEYIHNFCLNGLYSILVDLEEDVDEKTIKEDIRKLFNTNRNLCEDLVHITKIETQPISLCAEIEVEKEADEELVNAKILFEVNNYFSPSLRFYSIQEMLEKGYTTDQIFDGPTLNNGFIDIEELQNAALKSEVRLSDIMKIIMSVDGVKLIKEISIGNCDDSKTTDNEWNICIEENKKPILCSKSALNFNKGVLPLNVNEKRVEEYLLELKEAEDEAQESAKDNKQLKIKKGTYRNVSNYTTIQNDFPDTYGIGQEGLTSRATTKRKSQSKQLKAYLLFFDKILASYFKHLGKVKDLLAINGVEKNTYFTQAIKDIKGFDDLVDDYDANNEELLTKKIFEKFDNNIERRNEILDHLLARFAEQFGEYTFIMKSLYGEATDNIVLANKEAFLNEYDVISAERGAAFNYYKQKKSPPNDQLWNTDNVAGIQKRIARLMGIKNYKRRNLSDSFVEMYDLSTDPEIKKYRWRIKDENQIVLSSTVSYSSTSDARKELYFAVFQIMQTTEKMVIKAFEENNVLDEILIGKLYVHRANSGRYSFHIVDPTYPESHTDFIIAKQYRYYDTIAELKEGMLNLIQFMIKEFTEEGLFLVEHILLRPNVTNNNAAIESFLPICTDNCESMCAIDPYSYKITIVLPGYTFRFSNPDFRNYMETIIKEELPAHVLARICWVGERKGIVEDSENDLLQFEKSYEEYLKAKTNLIHEQPGDNNENEDDKNELKNLINSISELNTIYPTGSLIDCSDESDSLEGKIILGQTILGTL